MITQTELELQFQEATSFRDAGDFRAAKAILRHLARERPDAALKPRSEIASTAMFFTLANMGRDDEALAEMYRFLALRPSKEYAAILDEIAESAQ